MSVTVNKLYQSSKSCYGLKPVAGIQGLNNLVQWVHIMEESNVSTFLRGQELVFTTGVMNNTGKWLLNFAKQLYKANASALVVNTGPYIPSIDSDVIDFCNEVGLPLFSLPWKTRIVDITRDFCTLISQSLNDETEVSSAFKSLVFNKGNTAAHCMSLEGSGFSSQGKSRILCIGAKKHQSEQGLSDKIKNAVEQAAKSTCDLYCAFEYNKYLILLFPCCSKNQTDSFFTALKRLLRTTDNSNSICIGISQELTGFASYTRGFEYSTAACKMAAKHNTYYMYYDDMDIFKLLIDVEDKSLLLDYYNQTLGSLEAYDKEHGSSYMSFLKTYLDNNASAQLVSEKEFIHRNTVVNYLKKIDAITGMNMFELDTKVKCIIAFSIKELM